MRHKRKSEKFSRTRAQRKALIKSLLRAIIIHESIVTTESKAKGLRGWVDKVITLGKNDTLHSRRLLYKILCDHLLVKRVFSELAPRFNDRNSGYTRVIDKCVRKGDNAKLSVFEFVKLDKKVKGKLAKKEKAVVQDGEVKEEAKTDSEKEKAKSGLISNVKNMFHKGKKTSQK